MILSEFQRELSALSNRRTLDVARRRTATEVEYRGKVLLDFGHFDYLNVAFSPQLKRAMHEHVEREGFSPAAPRLQGGTTHSLLMAERALTKFLGVERSLLFPSRTQAVLSTLTAIAGERDVFLIDELTQGPYADAAYLVGAEVQTFASLNGLQRQLEKYKGSRRRFVVSDTLSPITGELTDLGTLSALVARFDAYLILDETYALGIIGLRGAGGAERLITSAKDPLALGRFCCIADLSYGLGAIGAVVAGSSDLIEVIIQRSKAMASDPPLPAHAGIFIDKAVEIVELAPLERERVLDLAATLREALPRSFVIGAGRNGSPIVCLQFPRLRLAEDFCTAVYQRGTLMHALPKSAPLSEVGIVRLVVNAAHTDRQIEDTQRLLAEILARFTSPT